jgi:UDP-N-acetylglucosamine 2-epimerase
MIWNSNTSLRAALLHFVQSEASAKKTKDEKLVTGHPETNILKALIKSFNRTNELKERYDSTSV